MGVSSLPDYKQVIVYNKNSKIPFNDCLKYIVLGSLNSVEASVNSSRVKVESWLKFGQKKVTLQIPNESDLLSLQKLCNNKKIVNVLVKNDQQVPCILVLGPDLEKILDPLTGKLRLF